MQKKYYNKLSPDLQKILKEAFRYHMARLSLLVREGNTKSKEVMMEHGIKMISADDALIRVLKQASMKTCELLTGKLYPDELLNLVMEKLKEYRNGGHYQDSAKSYVLQIDDVVSAMKGRRQ